MLDEEERKAAVERFREYLRFETVSRVAAETGAYAACGEWLVRELEGVGCFDSVFVLNESPKESPVVVAKWTGRNPSLPVILLNSHYDVVPAAPEDWSFPPFEGRLVSGGDNGAGKNGGAVPKIYGRGTQDMKCVGVQYMEAIRKIVCRDDNGGDPAWRPERTIYLTYVPDEEVGGAGMACFLESELYRSLPGISLALDEGLASTTEEFDVFYGERLPWFVSVEAHGPTGHGSRFIENNAVGQLVDLCNKALAFRQGQRELLLGGSENSNHQNCAHVVAAANRKKQEQQPNGGGDEQQQQQQRRLGDVTSLNITSLAAGVQSGGQFAYNCVPPLARCSLDIRIAPHTEPSEIGTMLDRWCRECSSSSSSSSTGDSGSQHGKPMEWSFLGRGHDGKKHALTSVDSEQNAWYAVFEKCLSDMGYRIQPQVFPAATDSRFLRALGIRALGFSPMRSTKETPCEILLHEDDENIPVETFLEGIEVYVGLIKTLGSQGEGMDN